MLGSWLVIETLAAYLSWSLVLWVIMVIQLDNKDYSKMASLNITVELQLETGCVTCLW